MRNTSHRHRWRAAAAISRKCWSADRCPQGLSANGDVGLAWRLIMVIWYDLPSDPVAVSCNATAHDLHFLCVPFKPGRQSYILRFEGTVMATVNRFDSHPLPGAEEVLQAGKRADEARRRAREATQSAGSRKKRSDEARRRCKKRLLRAARAKQHVRRQFGDTEDRMERMAEDYRYARLLGAHLPPMPTVEITVETARLQ